MIDWTIIKEDNCLMIEQLDTINEPAEKHKIEMIISCNLIQENNDDI